MENPIRTPQKKFEQNRSRTVREEALERNKVNTLLTKQRKVVAIPTACGSKPWLKTRFISEHQFLEYVMIEEHQCNIK